MCKKLKTSFVATALLLLGGCASSIDVIPLSDGAKKISTEKAIPYYLPMPCVLVTKNMSIVDNKQASESSGNAPASGGAANSGKGLRSGDVTVPDDKDHYDFKIIYLPDLDKQYGIKITKTLGTIKDTIKLEDGWKLTSLNLENDANTANIIKGVGDLIPNIISSLGATVTKEGAAVTNAQRQSRQPEKKIKTSEIWIFKITSEQQLSQIFHWSSVKQQ